MNKREVTLVIFPSSHEVRVTFGNQKVTKLVTARSLSLLSFSNKVTQIPRYTDKKTNIHTHKHTHTHTDIYHTQVTWVTSRDLRRFAVKIADFALPIWLRMRYQSGNHYKALSIYN
jgi:hypothetical protein